MNHNLLKAKILAIKSKNPTWLGVVSKYKVNVYSYNRKHKEALRHYKLALQYCSTSKDSICIAENLEQISSSYGELADFEKAHYYFELALPLLKKYKIIDLNSVAYNNLSTTLMYEKKYLLAQNYIDSAIEISVQSKDVYSEMTRKHSKGLLYIEMGQYDKALTIFQGSMETITKSNLKDPLMRNEFGQYFCYEKKGDYRRALDHLYKYYFYRDSLNDAEVKTEIADLETQYKYQKKKLDFKKTR